VDLAVHVDDGDAIADLVEHGDRLIGAGASGDIRHREITVYPRVAFQRSPYTHERGLRIVIEVDSLHRRFGTVHALRGLSFSVGPTGVWGLLGPNGAGKTTTLRILSGTLGADAGRVRVGGLDPCEPAARVRLGTLPQRSPLPSDLSVREYLAFRCALAGVPASERPTAIARELARCGLDSVRDRLCGALSSGFRQRAGLAASLVHTPRVVLLDEPSAGLDPVQAPAFRALLRDVGQSALVLVSSHVLAEVEQSCEGAVLMDHGATVAQGTLAELRAIGADDAAFVIEWQGARPNLGEGWREANPETLDGGWCRLRARSALPDAQDRLARAVQGGGRLVRRIEREPDALEAVFARLVGGKR
jgi:ABC-2 type transport system ATP-binding protein